MAVNCPTPKIQSALAFRFLLLTLSLFVLIVSTLLFHNEAFGGQVTVAWDPGSVSGLAGYKVHYGTVSRNYPYVADAGNKTTYTVTGLTAGATYYFAATAYDTAGTESAFSSEVAYTVPVSVSSPTPTRVYGCSLCRHHRLSVGQPPPPYAHLHVERGALRLLLLPVGGRLHWHQDPAMVHGCRCRLCLRYRDLLGDPQHHPQCGFRQVVDPDLGQRRLRSVERRDELYGQRGLHGCSLCRHHRLSVGAAPPLRPPTRGTRCPAPPITTCGWKTPLASGSSNGTRLQMQAVPPVQGPAR